MSLPEEKNKNNTAVPFTVPVEGSLGLLALGAVGIKAWREKRKEALEQLKKNKKDE